MTPDMFRARGKGAFLLDFSLWETLSVIRSDEAGGRLGVVVRLVDNTEAQWGKDSTGNL